MSKKLIFWLANMEHGVINLNYINTLDVLEFLCGYSLNDVERFHAKLLIQGGISHAETSQYETTVNRLPDVI